jgi:hypothetical protein
VAFKYFAIVIHAGVTDNTYDHVAIGEWELYGTEEASQVPIQIGGGNIDKVANFRVYDKFVGEDQALEIWDAQKDHFGRAKSSMTLYKGRLGLGTTEPEGRLAVLDEPNTFEPRWPPKPLVGYKTYIEGHGEFCVHRSGNESTGVYRGNSWWIFDDNQNTSNYTYHGERDVNDPINGNYSYFKGTNGEYTGGKSIGGIAGDWTVLESPKPIKINDIIRMRVRSAGQSTTRFIIAAANEFDAGVWTKLTEQSNLVWQVGGVGESKTFHFANDKYYKYYAIIITQNPNQYGYPTISNMEFSGIVQQGQSVLHDGQLTLTKNLTVPRIGPALDADDTPRRDRLVVEYNTSTNPTFEGAVRDTSGRGLDGTLVGGVSYSASQKALEFDGDGSNDYITSTINPSITGEFIHSFSIWFNFTALEGSYDYPILIGSIGVLNQTSILLQNSSGEIGPSFGSGYNLFTNFVPAINRWYHMVVVYRGGAVNVTNVDYYIDGVKKSISNQSGTEGTGTLAIDENALMLGDNPPSGGNPFKGSMSQFKLYDTALTAEEVKTLYDMGRCDEGHHVVNFSKTRVGIGLGDGEAPQAALDVRGDIAGPFHTFLTGDNTTTSSSPTSSAHSALVSHTFDVPKEYNSYGTTNLEVFGQVKWSGECPDPWNTNLSLRLYYGSGLTSYIGSAQVSGGSNSKGCGMIAISNATDNGSTLDSAIASSRFLIPNCSVGPGSQLKLELLHSQGAGSGTVYTNRTTGATTTDYNYERGTTNFFMALKVV